MLKIILFSCVNLLLVNLSHAANADLQELERKFFEKAEMYVDVNSSMQQKKSALIMIERLATQGERNSFQMLCDLNKGTKAAFMRDFLSHRLKKEALMNAKKYILKEQRNSPDFLPHLKRLIKADPEKNFINVNLNRALKSS